MTASQRLDLLARAYPRLFPRRELLRLLRTQLGDAKALDGWIMCDGVRIRARPPAMIYHICAGNLAGSAWTSLAHGILLGARNVVKLPGDRHDSSTRREILHFVRGLPKSLRRLVETHRTLDENLFSCADVIIAFGSDTTIGSLRARTRPDQKFIAHGHALSLLWIEEPGHLTPRQARACATDVLTYDQLGCLSPQAIYAPAGTDAGALGDHLARALEAEWRAARPKPPRPLPVAARIAEARDVALALGHRVWLPPEKHLGWTLIHDPNPLFEPSPLHGVIYLRTVAESKLPAALASVAGRISSVGVAGRMSSRSEETFLKLGISRFCPAGRMQFPPLTWHHDGRPVLADLVTWVDSELPA
ncbi:MAG TPA: acyl-CoA reductase [Candidatus Methylacidiphilales bacterium]|nr:acyl-CoA reductase [Candidatus Methylacidiphilales bacterium]